MKKVFILTITLFAFNSFAVENTIEIEEIKKAPKLISVYCSDESYAGVMGN